MLLIAKFFGTQDKSIDARTLYTSEASDSFQNSENALFGDLYEVLQRESEFITAFAGSGLWNSKLPSTRYFIGLDMPSKVVDL